MSIWHIMKLIFLLSLLVVPTTLKAQPNPDQPTEDKILSIGTTIGLALDNYGVLSPRLDHLERRGNPAARPGLYAILNDPASDVYWPGVIRMLGCVGDGADGQKLVTFLKNLREKPSDKAVWAVSYALALLRQRKQKGADALVDEVVRPAFWRAVRFHPTTKPARVKDKLPFELEMSRLAIEALAHVDLAYAKAKVAEVQASIDDRSQKQHYGEAVEALFR